jgi:hypothetical protein
MLGGGKRCHTLGCELEVKKLQVFPVYLWFPRDVFAYGEDYDAVRRLFESTNVGFETIKTGGDLLHNPKD